MVMNPRGEKEEKWRSKGEESYGSKLPASFAGYSFFLEGGPLINKTIIKMDESGCVKRNISREHVKSSWCEIIFIIHRALAAPAGALAFWLHQQSTVRAETLTLYCCVTLSSALSELMSVCFERWQCSPRCSCRWRSVCAGIDKSSVIGGGDEPFAPNWPFFFICRVTDVSRARTRKHTRAPTEEQKKTDHTRGRWNGKRDKLGNVLSKCFLLFSLGIQPPSEDSLS